MSHLNFSCSDSNVVMNEAETRKQNLWKRISGLRCGTGPTTKGKGIILMYRYFNVYCPLFNKSNFINRHILPKDVKEWETTYWRSYWKLKKEKETLEKELSIVTNEM